MRAGQGERPGGKETICGRRKRGESGREHRPGSLPGSYTVEAALLMGILLPLFVGIIYLGFYLHDRAFLQGASYEAAACASLHLQDDLADVEGGASSLVSGRMLGTSGVSTGYTSGEKEARVTYSGSLVLPGMTGPFFGAGSLSVGASSALSTERPSKKIQKIRGAAKIIRKLREI